MNQVDFLSTNFYNISDPADIARASVFSNKKMVDYFIKKTQNSDLLNTNSDYGHIEYNLNSSFFRNREIHEHNIDCAGFGCSFTFGDSLHIDQVWFSQLVSMLNIPVSYNFGQPGISAQNLRNIFIAATSAYCIKTAVILFPPYTRCLLADSPIGTLDLCENVNLHAESNITTHAFNTLDHKIYKFLPDLTLKMWFKEAICDIINQSKIKGINLRVSSWHDETYELLKLIANEHVLPPWPRCTPVDYAADNRHPGPKTHQLWVTDIVNYI